MEYNNSVAAGDSLAAFPLPTIPLERFGLKFSAGGAHISRTIMLKELAAVLNNVPPGSSVDDYRSAVVDRNVLGKTTESTRLKSLRHLRELYALDEQMPIFGLLRKLHGLDAGSLSLLALQVAWARDPLLRATTAPVLEAAEGERVETAALAQALETAFPKQYSELNRNKISRNASSSWTQSGHLTGRQKKLRHHVKPTTVVTSMALFLGTLAGYHGAFVFGNPWCKLIDLGTERAKFMGMEAHRAGLVNLRSVGEVVELSFPMFSEFEQ